MHDAGCRRAFAAWDDTEQLVRAMTRIGPARMAHVVGARLQQFIVIRLMSTSVLDREVQSAVCTLSSAFQVTAPRAAEVMPSRSRSSRAVCSGQGGTAPAAGQSVELLFSVLPGV